jgi:hypothetical protein
VGSAILAWFAKEGVGLLLGAVAKLLLDGWNEYRADQAFKRAGAAEATSKVNVETLETKNAMDDVVRPSDDAVADSLRTGKF